MPKPVPLPPPGFDDLSVDAARRYKDERAGLAVGFLSGAELDEESQIELEP
jgi:hypothetical protein